MQFVVVAFVVVIGILFVLAIFAAVTPLAMFAMKAGLIRPPAALRTGLWKPEAVWGWAILVAAILTALGALGMTFWGEGHPGWKGSPVLTAYYNRYGVPGGCSRSQWFCGAIYNVIRADALPFFVATTIFLYSRAAALYARNQGKSLLPFIAPALVGAAVFFVSIHIWDWVDVVRQTGVTGVASKIATDFARELVSPVTFVQAIMNGAGWAWLENEIAQMGLSIYKIASLYPKIFLVFIFGGIIQYSVREP